MKKIGIIGGAGPLASALLYETLIQESYALGSQVPEMILINYPFTRGLTLNEGKENQEMICRELNYCVQFLAENGAEVGILACNTLHLFLTSSLCFYRLPELVMRAAQRNNHRRLLILGTQNTCRFSLYQFEGIESVYPSFQDQEVLDAIIDRVLEGKILKEDADRVGQIIEKNSRDKAFEGVVLGCTDFPVLHHHFPIPSMKPIYDSIKIPAKTLIGSSLREANKNKEKKFL